MTIKLNLLAVDMVKTVMFDYMRLYCDPELEVHV